MLVSCFLCFGCLREEYVSLSDDLRTPESFTDLTAFSDFAVLFVYSARTLGNSTHTHSFLSPTMPCLSHISRQEIVIYLHTLQALRLMATAKLPIDFCVFDSMLSTHKSCGSCFASFRILSKLFHSYGWHSSSRLRPLLTT